MINKKAVLGILLVLFLPLTAYFILKSYTDRDAIPPPHYIPDSTIVITKKGKRYIDTVWHKISDFQLTNQLGKKVSWSDIPQKLVVANFFFTHCPTICPTLTKNMKALQESIRSSEKVGNRDPDFIQFLSFSIDPERDSVAELKKWADRFQIDPQNWWLLTGDKKQIYDLSINEMRLPAEDGGLVDSSFAHTDVFVLIDKKRNIRGYYHSLKYNESGGFTTDSASMAKLSRDIIFLALERDPSKKFFLAGKLHIIAIAFVIAGVALVVLMNFLKKEKA